MKFACSSAPELFAALKAASAVCPWAGPINLADVGKLAALVEEINDEDNGDNPTDIQERQETQRHRLFLTYSIYGLQPWGFSDNPMLYFALYSDPEELWNGSQCNSHETWPMYNKWTIGPSTWKLGAVDENKLSKFDEYFFDPSKSTADVCSLLESVAKVGSFRYNEETTHKVTISSDPEDLLVLDKPQIPDPPDEEFEPEPGSSNEVYGNAAETLKGQCVNDPELDPEQQTLPLPAGWQYRPVFRSGYSAHELEEIFLKGEHSEIPVANFSGDPLGFPLSTITHDGVEITLQPKAVPALRYILNEARFENDISVVPFGAYRSICKNADPTTPENERYDEHSLHLAGLAVLVSTGSEATMNDLAAWINQLPGVHADVCNDVCELFNIRITFEASEFREPIAGPPPDVEPDPGGPS